MSRRIDILAGYQGIRRDAVLRLGSSYELTCLASILSAHGEGKNGQDGVSGADAYHQTSSGGAKHITLIGPPGPSSTTTGSRWRLGASVGTANPRS